MRPLRNRAAGLLGRRVVLFCPERLWRQWPNPLARRWADAYPNLFDADDFRLTREQPRNHFVEWFAATCLYHRYGTHALLKKYTCGNHSGKAAVLEAWLNEDERAFLKNRLDGMPPDLFLYRPGQRRFWFAEVKGPGDPLSESQVRNHRRIADRLGVPVWLVSVKRTGSRRPRKATEEGPHPAMGGERALSRGGAGCHLRAARLP